MPNYSGPLLIIEEHRPTRVAFVKFAKDLFEEVVSCSSYEHGRKMLETSRFALVSITCECYPLDSAQELIRHQILRPDSLNSSTPCIAIGTDIRIGQELGSGIEQFLLKPVLAEVLQDAFSKAIQSKD